MAKPTILKERGTGEELYPRTLASLVHTSTGENVEEAIDEAELKVFVDMWDDACGINGKYDPQNAPDIAHSFYLNKLWFTYREAIKIYNYSIFNLLFTLPRNGSNQLLQTSTVLPFNEIGNRKSWDSTFYRCWKLRVVAVTGNKHFVVNNAHNMFCDCKTLEEVISPINMEMCSNASGMFQNCIKLSSVNILRINCNVSFEQSPLLALESVRYLVDNRLASQTSPIAITVHADVYAKLTGDTTNAAAAALTEEEAAAWQQVLADGNAKNISFACL